MGSEIVNHLSIQKIPKEKEDFIGYLYELLG